MPAKEITILLIDGDLATVQDVHSVLAHEGYGVNYVVPGLPAIRKMLVEEPDLVILGIDRSNGRWRFCRQLMTFLDRPLLLMLSSASELDRAKGLELGADDCLTKPVLAVELVARVRALLRRRPPEVFQPRRSFYVDGELVVDLTHHEVRLGGEQVTLLAKEFRILECLIRHVNHMVPYETLLLEVWGADREVTGGNLKPHIHNLRRKLEPDPHRPQRIVTHRGGGYMLRQLAAEE